MCNLQLNKNVLTFKRLIISFTILALVSYILLLAIDKMLYVDEELNVKKANEAVSNQSFNDELYSKRDEVLEIIKHVEENQLAIIKYIDSLDNLRKYPLYSKKIKMDTTSCRIINFSSNETMKSSIPPELTNKIYRLESEFDTSPSPLLITIEICQKNNKQSKIKSEPNIELGFTCGYETKYFITHHFLFKNKNYKKNTKMEYVRDFPILIDTNYHQDIKYGIKITPFEAL